MRIADILRSKGHAVATIEPEATVSALLARLAEGNYGALPVVQDGRLVGMVSERDVVRKLHERGADLLGIAVSEIMTTVVATCTPDDGVSHLAQVMTNRRVRHLPVVVDEELLGIVSIGDLVKARIDSLERERQQLESYIAQ
ncbi:CBS domain-containing protein [Pseudonocardia halophobica]|uniref:Signal transduction protein n=1 Tax=Pseudonocardia halophobica TaxID=29401 RepID=A0A9W6NTW2_9PSEU|nr:CBS domain-containing protein [Pseudonocardia halophobica]GLL09164.1 signal transduction protein [Pseudonocardia halophobica]